MREGSYSQSDTEEPAEVTPRRKDRFFIPISASYIASKGKGNGKIVSVKNVSSKVFLDRFPESANHKQQWGAHFQEDGAMTQTSIIKAWKKLFLPWIARHLQLYHRFSWSCISVWLFVFGFWMHIYIYMSLIVLDSSSLTSGPWSLTLGPWLLVGGSMILESGSLTLGPVAAGH